MSRPGNDSAVVTAAKATLSIPVAIPGGERCQACVAEIREAVDALPGVGSVEVDAGTSMLAVRFDAQAVTRETLVAEVERIGHDVSSAIGHAAWRVTGLDCPDCARTVDKSVGYLDGVLSASLNFASGVLSVEYDASEDPRQAIADLVRRMDYGVEPLGDAAARPVAEFTLDGLDCAGCVDAAGERVRSLSGVTDVVVDAASPHLRVGYDPAATSSEILAEEIRRIGYAFELVGEAGAGVVRSWWEMHRAEVATAASGVLIALGWALGYAGADVVSTVLFALAIVTGGGLIFRRALGSLKARVLDMNVLMSVAVVGAAAIGEWSESAMVVFLFSIGGLLESRSLARTRHSIRDLMDLAPEIVHVLRDGERFDLVPSEVAVSDLIEVRPGERVPLDGRVVDGSSAVDESAITGESVPVEKGAESVVYAGTLNTSGLLRVRVTARAADTTLARIVYLVEEAQAQRAPFQRLVDRFTRWYTPTVVGLAAAVAVVPPVAADALGASWGGFDVWFYRALVLLVVSCPCALVISTPVAVVSAITRAARDGVLVKGGAFLEIAPRIGAVAFDKTGTLTVGRPEVTDVIVLHGTAAQEALGIAAALETHSTHPVAEAIVRAAETGGGMHLVEGVVESAGRGVGGRVDGVEYVVGSVLLAEERGVPVQGVADEVAALEAAGRTALLLFRDQSTPSAIAVFGVADAIRPSAARAISALRNQGIGHVVMLTGDNERTAEAIARSAGVTEVSPRLLPEEKGAVVGELRERYGSVAMVGDGINDAPALARADIGIAMGAAGSDTALETAHVALMTDDLLAIPRFFALGRRTVANIRQNVALSIGVKVAVLVAAVAGYAALWLAVFADTGVAILVILNGLRLLRART
ncbi:MAG: heavy metal translocating P-type ATPase [Coriobacteriia bacterium]|nr:heavy metal translocating P-type ATPase [Coriobacteriia bacterium]